MGLVLEFKLVNNNSLVTHIAHRNLKRMLFFSILFTNEKENSQEKFT